MKKIEKWEAVDGTIFNTEEECIEYESKSAKITTIHKLAESLPDLDKFINCLQLISLHCDNCIDCKEFCPFVDEYKGCIFTDFPNSWNIDEITKLFTKIDNMNKEKNNNDK